MAFAFLCDQLAPHPAAGEFGQLRSRSANAEDGGELTAERIAAAGKAAFAGAEPLAKNAY